MTETSSSVTQSDWRSCVAFGEGSPSHFVVPVGFLYGSADLRSVPMHEFIRSRRLCGHSLMGVV